MARTSSTSSIVLGALVLVGLGCGVQSKPVPVNGTVVFNGRPLARATVVYVALDPGGRDANGFTDADGVFRLSTYGANDGALPGKYKVLVQYSDEGTVPADLTNPADVQKAIATGRIKPKVPSIIIPPQYSQPDETILEQEVPTKEEVILRLEGSKR